jgi:hypothetical protein
LGIPTTYIPGDKVDKLGARNGTMPKEKGNQEIHVYIQHAGKERK